MADFKIPSFFILFLTFVLIWVYHSHKGQKKYQAEKEAFWQQEEASLLVRKKEIPADLYFRPKINQLLFPCLDLSPDKMTKYNKLKDQIQASAPLPMVCFSDLSNAEIRLQFGTANQTFISQAEENYWAFLGFLYEYALFMAASHPDQAVLALEEAIRLKSDISHHFILLADLYAGRSNVSALENLLVLAQSLKSSSKSKILDHIHQLLA